MRFDATGAETARYDIGFSSLGFHHADLDLDGIDEVLVTDRAGWLHVLSPDLKLLRKAEVTHNQFEMVDLQIAGTADLEGDSQPEIVLTSAQIEAVSGSNESIRNAIPNVRYGRNRSVVVLNRELNEVTRYRVGTDSSVSFGLQARVANFARVGITGILVVSDKVAMLELR